MKRGVYIELFSSGDSKMQLIGKCNSEKAVGYIWCIIILAHSLEIRQFKKRQNFPCLLQSKSAKISRCQNNPIYGMAKI